MESIYSIPAYDTPIRQGDVIKKVSRIGNVYGLVITADCDIARGRHGNHYTWIEIIPSAKYIDEKWLPIEIGKILSKQVKSVLEYVNSKLKAKGLGELSDDRLISWITDIGAKEFLLKISEEEPPAEILSKLEGLIILMDPGNQSALDRVKKSASYFRINVENFVEGAKKHLVKFDDGFPDFFYIPKLPEELSGGCTALLRNIYSIQNEEIFLSESDARINDCPSGFFRMCRLSDRVKYSVVQKTTFLFSRIGMTPEFEALTSESAENSSRATFGAGV
ncbi:TPA: hypothetical protein L4R02_003742 [Pseudomonas aeruginosa]|nr:hypothetical protein [Pseudomonas aeruginosa]